MITLLLAIRTESEANLRESWHVKAKRVKLQRSITRTMFSQKFRPARVGSDYAVTLTRIAPRPLDTDNLARSFKAIRDGIADALGIDDGSKRFTWNYAQEKGPPKRYAVRIQIETGKKESEV
jgi:crossover junction endodeoxyribonuclease RusA